MGAMVKGDKPYDQATVDAALAQLDDTAKKLPTMFPEGVKGLKGEGDYSLPRKSGKIKPALTSISQASARAVTDAKASVKDLDTLKAALPTIGKQCGGCHETFRVKNS